MERLRERLEDIICHNCAIEPACSDNNYHCEAFNRLMSLVIALSNLSREAGDLIEEA